MLNIGPVSCECAIVQVESHSIHSLNTKHIDMSEQPIELEK